MRQIAEFAHENGLLKTIPDIDVVVDQSIAEEVERELRNE
jgi:hypothetical protein